MLWALVWGKRISLVGAISPGGRADAALAHVPRSRAMEAHQMIRGESWEWKQGAQGMKCTMCGRHSCSSFWVCSSSLIPQSSDKKSTETVLPSPMACSSEVAEKDFSHRNETMTLKLSYILLAKTLLHKPLLSFLCLFAFPSPSLLFPLSLHDAKWAQCQSHLQPRGTVAFFLV